jgi:hypothetical protein
MHEIELLENLIDTTKGISYTNKDEFEPIRKRTEMIVRKLFGDESHYLKDLNNISYSPMIIFSGSNTDWKTPFESGIREFKILLEVMLEDKKLSSNYDNPSVTITTTQKITTKTNREIRVVIASPSDVVRERELLLDKLETKFRRDGNEDKCGARIVVSGWEQVASQSGYAQDIINEVLIKEADIIVAVFRHKLGAPTKDLVTGTERSASGTAEEILYAIKNKTVENPPLGMAYFYGNAPVVSLDSVDFDKQKEQWDKLKAFKTEIQDIILYKQYTVEEQLIDIVSNDLSSNIIKYFKS